VNGRRIIQDLGHWSARSGPLYRRLAEALRAAINRGDLPASTRLPPERALAQHLGVSRTTVVMAYDVLRADDVLESRQGSGTWVRQGPDPSDWVENGSAAPKRDATVRGLTIGRGLVVDFTCGCLPPLPGLVEEAVAQIKEDLADVTRDHGYGALGLPRLRRAIARHLERSGLTTHENQILVTNGAQQALGLVAALVLERGSGVLIESPTYLGAMDVLTAAGARLLPVPVGTAGARVEVIHSLAHRRVGRLAYLTPTFHNPTGTVMPEAERREVARLVAETNLPLIEDNTLADIALEETPPRPIAAWAGRAPVITIGSMSKLFWGGLRVGWIRAPEALVVRLASLKVATDLGTSVLSQLVAARLLDRSEEIRQRRRQQILERRGALMLALRDLLPSWTWQTPKGGLSLWARIPHGDSRAYAQEALRHGVAVLSGPATSPDEGHSDHLRLVFVHEPPAVREGVERLARAWKAYSPVRSRPRTIEVMV
jgi:DNA-binding transcriptional MocR family regulator